MPSDLLMSFLPPPSAVWPSIQIQKAKCPDALF
jgi:hypothetical protein